MKDKTRLDKIRDVVRFLYVFIIPLILVIAAARAYGSVQLEYTQQIAYTASLLSIALVALLSTIFVYKYDEIIKDTLSKKIDIVFRLFMILLTIYCFITLQTEQTVILLGLLYTYINTFMYIIKRKYY